MTPTCKCTVYQPAGRWYWTFTESDLMQAKDRPPRLRPGLNLLRHLPRPAGLQWRHHLREGGIRGGTQHLRVAHVQAPIGRRGLWGPAHEGSGSQGIVIFFYFTNRCQINKRQYTPNVWENSESQFLSSIVRVQPNTWLLLEVLLTWHERWQEKQIEIL